jgi:predicted nucleic acid-binding Zn finger protein
MEQKERILFEKLNQEKMLNGPLMREFEDLYGDLFFKALEYIQSDKKKVVKHVFSPSNLILWTIQGTEKPYIIYPDLFCQCQAFLLESIYRNHKFKMCKHLLAQCLAEALNLYEIDNEKDNSYKEFLKTL